MRRVVGYTPEGRAIWSDNQPASTGSTPLGGTIQYAESGSYEKQRARSHKGREKQDKP